MIKVIFRINTTTGEVIAFFPELPGTYDYHRGCLGYIHVGQHVSATISYYQDCTRPATPDEYKDLLDELQQIYDGQLRPCRHMAYGDLLKRKEAVNS